MKSVLPSQVVQIHHMRRTMKMNITAVVGYLCHTPAESTNDIKTKATKKEVILSNDGVRKLDVNEMWSDGLTPREVRHKEGCKVQLAFLDRDGYRDNCPSTYPSKRSVEAHNRTLGATSDLRLPPRNLGAVSYDVEAAIARSPELPG